MYVWYAISWGFQFNINCLRTILSANYKLKKIYIEKIEFNFQLIGLTLLAAVRYLISRQQRKIAMWQNVNFQGKIKALMESFKWQSDIRNRFHFQEAFNHGTYARTIKHTSDNALCKWMLRWKRCSLKTLSLSLTHSKGHNSINIPNKYFNIQLHALRSKFERTVRTNENGDRNQLLLLWAKSNQHIVEQLQFKPRDATMCTASTIPQCSLNAFFVF